MPGAGLYRAKPAFVRRLRRLEDALIRRGVSPDALTGTALVAAVATAAALVAGTAVGWLWLAVAPLSLARMACNALDGSIARRTAAASPRGAALNELADRAADVVTFVALVPAVGLPLALAVTLTAVLTSFVAVTAQAVLGTRSTAGPLGKPDRVAVLSVAATAAVVAGPAALAIGAWAVIALGALTVARRCRQLLAADGVAS